MGAVIGGSITVALHLHCGKIGIDQTRQLGVMVVEGRWDVVGGGVVIGGS